LRSTSRLTVDGARPGREAIVRSSGQVRDLRCGWTLPQAWIPEGRGGRYLLTVQTQPTIRPTRNLLETLPPEGMVITGHSDGVGSRTASRCSTSRAAAASTSS
jgi:hypothetical protein